MSKTVCCIKATHHIDKTIDTRKFLKSNRYGLVLFLSDYHIVNKVILGKHTRKAGIVLRPDRTPSFVRLYNGDKRDTDIS